MSESPIRLRVFLSSPADVLEERQIARDVLESLGHSHLLRDRIAFDIVAWDDDHAAAPLDARETPQASVNRYAGRPSECDLTLVFLWSRIGTVLPAGMARADGTLFQSGTVWEYEDALTAGKPVWVYLRGEKPSIDLDDADIDSKRAQYRSVQAFVAGFKNADGSAGKGINAYPTPRNLPKLLRQHLEAFVHERLAWAGRQAPFRHVVTARVTTDDWLAGILASGLPAFSDLDPTEVGAIGGASSSVVFWLPTPPRIFTSAQGRGYTTAVALCMTDPEAFLRTLLEEAGESLFVKLKLPASKIFKRDLHSLLSAIGSAARHAFIACVAVPRSLLEPARHNPSLGLETLSNLFIAPILSLHTAIGTQELAVHVAPVGDETRYLINQTKRLAKLIFARKEMRYEVDLTTTSPQQECLADVARILAWATHRQHNEGESEWIDAVELAARRVGAGASQVDTPAPGDPPR